MLVLSSMVNNNRHFYFRSGTSRTILAQGSTKDYREVGGIEMVEIWRLIREVSRNGD